MRVTDTLTDRQRAVLSIIVRAYIKAAAPVGSKAIAENFALGVSPATIRNEMAALEELGFLTHPHTSAGRVPTIKGYRYFVESLMEDTELPLDDQRRIQHQFGQATQELEEWLRLSAAVLAHTARTASLVTAPKAAEGRLKHAELISIRDTLVLLIMVMQDGTVKQQMLTVETPLSQDEWSRLSNKLNAMFSGLTRAEIIARTTTQSLTPMESQAVEHLVTLMREADQRRGEVYKEGVDTVLSAPEFADRGSDILRRLDNEALEQMLAGLRLPPEGVQVFIGGEGPGDRADMGVVAARYGQPDEVEGVVSVVGPVRMPYDRAVSTVRYVARIMSTLVRELYGY